MTVHDNLAFPLRNRGLRASEIKDKVREIARMLDLEESLHRRAAGLTADGKQKISLGRRLVRSDVNVIMFDEPLTVIDPHVKWQLRSKLKELHQRIARTMIYVTHDQTEALTFADILHKALRPAHRFRWDQPTSALRCGCDRAHSPATGVSRITVSSNASMVALTESDS
jgi:glycerol transport system ATP-binding protein